MGYLCSPLPPLLRDGVRRWEWGALTASILILFNLRRLGQTSFYSFIRNFHFLQRFSKVLFICLRKRERG